MHDGKLWRSYARDVRFGKAGYTFKRGLQLPVEVRHLPVVGIRWNPHLRAHTHQRFLERLRDHELIPGVEDPRFVNRNIESRHGLSGGAR